MSRPVPHSSLQGENFLRALLAIAEADTRSEKKRLNWKSINANSWLANHDEEESLTAELPGFSTRAKFLGDAFPLLEQMGFVTIPRRNTVLITDAGRDWYDLFQSDASTAREQFADAIGQLWFATYENLPFEQFQEAIAADWNTDENNNPPDGDALHAMYQILDAFGYMDAVEAPETEAVSEIDDSDATADNFVPDDSSTNNPDELSDVWDTPSTEDIDEQGGIWDDNSDDFIDNELQEKTDHSTVADSEPEPDTDESPVSDDSSSLNPFGSGANEEAVSHTDEIIPTRDTMDETSSDEQGDSVDVSNFSSLQNDDVDNLLSGDGSPLDSFRRSAGWQVPEADDNSETPETSTAGQLESDFWRNRSESSDLDAPSSGSDKPSSIHERVLGDSSSSEDANTNDNLPSFTDFDRTLRERQKRDEELRRSQDDASNDEDELPNPFNRLSRARQQDSSDHLPGGDDLPPPGQRSELFGESRDSDDPLADSPLDGLRRARGQAASSSARGSRPSGKTGTPSPEKIEQITRVRSEGRMLEVMLVNHRLVRVQDHRGSLFEVDAQTLENWRDEHGGTFIEALLDLRRFMRQQTDLDTDVDD